MHVSSERPGEMAVANETVSFKNPSIDTNNMRKNPTDMVYAACYVKPVTCK